MRCLLCFVPDLSYHMPRLYFSSPAATFATNPQYRIQVTIIDEKEVNDKNILLSLMLKPKQQHRKQTRSEPIGLTLFKVRLLKSV